MAQLVFYQKPACTTCRKVKSELEHEGVAFECVNYYETVFSKQKLKEILAKLKIPAAGLLRKKEPLYRELKLDQKKITEEALIDLMLKHPDLIERPIVVKGTRAILARPAERIREFF